MSKATSYATNSTLSIQAVDHSDLEEALGVPWVAEAVDAVDLRDIAEPESKDDDNDP